MKIFTTIFCLFFSIALSAQLGYKEGFILTNTLDTIYGKIRNATEGERSARVIFVEQGTKNKIKYRPFTIKGFSVDGSFYESRIYDIHPSLSYGLGVFMRRLNRGEGPVKIYQYWNTDADRGFAQTFLVKGRDPSIEINYLRFKKHIAEFVKDYPKLQQKVLSGAFKKRDLGLIIAEYNAYLKK